MESKREKDSFEKNKYKFEEVNSGKIGKEKDGFLVLGKKDLTRIKGEGKPFKPKRGNKSGGRSGGRSGGKAGDKTKARPFKKAYKKK